MRFSPSTLDDIRARLPISQVVGRRVTYDRRKSQPARGDFWACCPFHQEKTPSFHCDDRRGIYHCFGCGATGDHFKFVTETEGLSFAEAVERLAEEAGVTLPKADPRDRERDRVATDLIGVVEIAAKFFEQRLRAPEGKPARDYLVRRGFTEKTVAEFRLGWAPDERDALKRHLVQAGVPEELAVTAGLLIKPDDGRSTYDRFRGRAMIPIHDERGRVVAFGGRTLDPQGQPKYLNSPETPLFHKGTMLFNVHRAREAAHKSGSIIVTEGYLDAIAVHQAGVRNVVAALGTAFTEDHIQRLWRLASEPVICFDGDKAGVSAAHRAMDRILPLLKSGFSFNFCFLPDGKDPDDIVRGGGADAFLAETAKARPLSEVLWEREVEGARIDTPERKAALEARLNDLVSQIADKTVAHRYRLQFRLDLSNLFWKQDRGLRGQSRPPEIASTPKLADEPTMANVERLIIGLSIDRPFLFEKYLEKINRIEFQVDIHKKFVLELYKILLEHPEMNVETIYKTISPDFFFFLNSVHGERDDRRGLERGHALHSRLPILRFHPPERFVEDIFDVLVLRIVGRTMKDDIESEKEYMKIAPEYSEDRAQRFISLLEEHNHLWMEIMRREKELEEESNAIRKASYPALEAA